MDQRVVLERGELETPFKAWRLALGACVAALSLAACRGAPPGTSVRADVGPDYSAADDPIVNPPELFEPFPVDNPERADEDATLMLHSLDSPETLNPLFLNTWSNGWVRDLLFDLLVFRNAEMASEPNFEVVERWKVSEDRRITTVTLKEGLYWHDGEPFTSADVAFSWEANTDLNVPAVFWQARAAEIVDAEILDDRTVRFTHRNPTAIGTEHLYFPIVPEHIWNNSAERAADPTLKSSVYHNYWAREELVGNGPYRFVEYLGNVVFVCFANQLCTITDGHFNKFKGNRCWVGYNLKLIRNRDGFDVAGLLVVEAFARGRPIHIRLVESVRKIRRIWPTLAPLESRLGITGYLSVSRAFRNHHLSIAESGDGP